MLVAAKAGRDEGYLERITISLDESVPEGRGPTAVALRECRPFVNNDTSNNPFMGPWRDAQLKRGFRSSASFPLKVSGECVGVISLYADAADYFDEEEVRLLTALADDFSFALESGESAKQREAALKELQRSQEELGRRAERLALLKDLAEIGASSLEVSETADLILDRLTDRLRPKIATILVIDDDGKHLVPLALRGFTADDIKQHFGPVAVDGPGLSPAVFRSKKASYVADSETDPAVSEQVRAFNRSIGVRAGVSAPLVVRGETIGTISFAWEAPRVIETEEITFLESVASEAAIGLQSARLFETQREAARYAGALNRMNDAIHSTLQIEEIMRAVVQEAKDAMGTDLAVVEIREGEEWPVRYAAGSPEVVLGRPLSPERALMSLTVAARGAPVLVTDAMADESFRELAVNDGITAFAGVPLVIRGETFGVLLLVDYRRTRHFGDLEQDFIGKLGASVSLALENARLFELAASARTNRVLAEISELLASTMDVDAAASEALAKAAGSLGAVAAVMTRIDDDGRFIVARAWGRLADLAGRHLGRDQLPSHAEALDTGHPVLVGDVLESSVANRRLSEEMAIRSFAIYPLIVHGEETGTLAFAFVEPRESFDELEKTTMLRLAYTLSTALQNAELFGAQEQAARDAQALNRINDAIHSTLDFDEIMNRVVVEANDAFGSESASIVRQAGRHVDGALRHGFRERDRRLEHPRGAARIHGGHRAGRRSADHRRRYEGSSSARRMGAAVLVQLVPGGAAVRARRDARGDVLQLPSRTAPHQRREGGLRWQAVADCLPGYREQPALRHRARVGAPQSGAEHDRPGHPLRPDNGGDTRPGRTCGGRRARMRERGNGRSGGRRLGRSP